MQISCAGELRHVLVDLHTVGALAWQTCRQLRIVELPANGFFGTSADAMCFFCTGRGAMCHLKQ